MDQFDHDLKMYAEHGLRTAEDWLTLDRQVQPAQTPRSEAKSRDRVVQLFSRDQTQRVVSRVRSGGRVSQDQKGPAAITVAARE